MAYNNAFPVGYGQYYPTYPQYNPQVQQAPQAQPQQPQPAANNLIWVQGLAGAKSYLVAPNTTVQLWDSESQVIYLKSADGSGMPSMKILDYTIREDSAPAAPSVVSSQAPVPAPDLGDYVTKKDLEAFEEKIKKQIRKMKEADDE